MARVFESGCANQQYVMTQLTHRARLVLESSTEGANLAARAGVERQREATELVAHAAELQLRVARGELPQRAVQERCAQLLARSRTLLASNVSGVVDLNAANKGRAAAVQDYDKLIDFNYWVQGAFWAATAPPMPQLPQLPPPPPVQRFEAMQRQEAAEAVLAFVAVPKAAVAVLRLRKGWRAWVAKANMARGVARVGIAWLAEPLAPK